MSTATPGHDVPREIDGVRAYKQLSMVKPGLLQLETVDETPEYFYYIMELADPMPPAPGDDPHVYRPRTLAAELARRGRIPPREALAILHDVLTGLRELHDKGCVHFDVKPANILFVNGRAKLADVGLVAPVDGLDGACQYFRSFHRAFDGNLVAIEAGGSFADALDAETRIALQAQRPIAPAPRPESLGVSQGSAGRQY